MDPQQLKDVKRALGRRLAAWRKTRGLIQDDVARLVNSTRSTVAGVERGEQVVDRVFWVQCESLLQAGGELIDGYDEYRSFEIRHREEEADAARHARWAQSSITRRSPRPAPPTGFPIPTGGDSILMQDPRGAYVGVRQAIMIVARETSKHAMDTGASRAVSDLTIEQLHDDAIGIARGFGQLTPTATINEALRVRGLAVEALERTRRPGQQHELYLITVQATALLASAAVDLGLWSPAMQYARAAGTYGEIIGHAGVRAYARGMQATIAYWTGRYEEAVRYAAAAASPVPPGSARGLTAARTRASSRRRLGAGVMIFAEGYQGAYYGVCAPSDRSGSVHRAHILAKNALRIAPASFARVTYREFYSPKAYHYLASCSGSVSLLSSDRCEADG
ncbi:helix-turn-helix domain-containing protein [Salinispora tropica]|uniref:helix-turn-helix domain-containing protein n=1 Tax=Salinispora tropica TaxID=168695 RepID=UPI000366DC4A|nr:helix-turn-helix transcriptional regulator [Salinispora tropica]